MNCDTKNGLEQVGGKILFLGDSITDQGHFLSFLNSYFRLYLKENTPVLRNLGVSSETVCGLSEPAHPFPRPNVAGRLQRALSETAPDWVVIWYGINDGIYYPLSEERLGAYQAGMRQLVRTVQQYGARAVVLTPPPFDVISFQKAQGEGHLLPQSAPKFSYMEPFAEYNSVMAAYGEWLKSDFSEEAERVIDVYSPLVADRQQMREQQADYTDGDGIHPSRRGHWVVARTLLKELFGISADRFYSAMEKDEFRLFELVQTADLLGHRWDKELVGHDNPYKETLPTQSEQVHLLAEAGKAIDSHISSHRELLEQVSEWRGYPSYHLHLEGYEAIVVAPKHPASGRPWVWRTEFFGAFAAADEAMVAAGAHLVHLAIPDRFGCPAALETMTRFHQMVTERFSLCPKAILFGFSRGGLYALHYAGANPEKVAGLYLDAPVVDGKSWPGGFGNGVGSPYDWAIFRKAFGVTGGEDLLAEMQKLAGKLAAAGIPLCLVAGDSDEVVPFSENGAHLVPIWKESGTAFQLILKPGVGHHPHSLEQPAPIVEFLLREISNMKR